MPNQTRKHTLGLSGEFFVAAQLLRHGVMASVTYGNAKKIDVVAFSASGTVATVLEVKSTSERCWVVGNSVPEPSPLLWVFVHLPHDQADPPRYFVFTAEELHGVLMPNHRRYLRNYRKKHGKKFKGPGVIRLELEAAEPYENKWQEILHRISIT
jgi:hypothetical protein